MVQKSTRKEIMRLVLFMVWLLGILPVGVCFAHVYGYADLACFLLVMIPISVIIFGMVQNGGYEDNEHFL